MLERFVEHLERYLATPANPTSKCMANPVLSSAAKCHTIPAYYLSSLLFICGS